MSEKLNNKILLTVSKVHSYRYSKPKGRRAQISFNGCKIDSSLHNEASCMIFLHSRFSFLLFFRSSTNSCLYYIVSETSLRKFISHITKQMFAPLVDRWRSVKTHRELDFTIFIKAKTQVRILPEPYLWKIFSHRSWVFFSKMWCVQVKAKDCTNGHFFFHVFIATLKYHGHEFVTWCTFVHLNQNKLLETCEWQTLKQYKLFENLVHRIISKKLPEFQKIDQWVIF